MKSALLSGLGLAAFVVGGYFALESFKDDPSLPLSIIVPELSQQAKAGERAFSQNCAACHGENASGSEQGPPLIHKIYNPGHHSDQAFFAAAQNGVRAHHWSFGNMPALRNVPLPVVADIVAYVREMQQANGIKFQQHKM